ncbi:hypothetical protein EDC94DRAFT_656876 [Helicostylum pulchrum]|nr:hypothetical protein EDC94DRAFT_656876 [Helicostylum pulchrum]
MANSHQQSGIYLFEKGKTYYNNQDYETAILYFVKAREAGHAESQIYVAEIYYHGLGVETDYKTALFWYKLAGENGNVDAQRMVGVIYYDGKVGGIPDYQQAMEWLYKSARNGDSEAHTLIGLMHFRGSGTTKNFKEALDWYKQAIAKGDYNSFYTIGAIYLLGGYGVDRDFDLAETSLMRGVDKQTPSSIFGMGELYGFRCDSKQSWKEAFKWCMNAAEYNQCNAQHILGYMYEDGLGCKKDYALAMKWYKKAEENGCVEGIVSIGRMHHYGYGVPVNYIEAMRQYQKAGNCGAALNGIGLLYQGGLDVIQSHSTAILYFEKAANMGYHYGDVYNSLGDVYKNGYGRGIDIKVAFEYYTKSANGYSKDGMLNFGIAYMEGSGTEVNRDLALYWFQRADLFGNEEAKNYIEKIIRSSPESGTDSFEKGKTCYHKQDHETAVRHFVKAHEAGHVESQIYLAEIYYHGGLEIAKDYSKALSWYKLAGENGNVNAQTMIGFIYNNGLVGTPNYQQATEWLHKAARNGSYGACTLLGQMYFEGKGNPKNYKEALYWYEKAVNKGECGMFYTIGYIYLYGGYGVDKKFDLAEIWFMKGVAKKDPPSIFGMGVLYGLRSDSEHSWEKAFEWCSKAKKNVDSAQHSLGYMYEDGLGCKKDYALAMKWYKKAEENGCVEGIVSIGRMHHYGYGVPVNYIEAMRQYQKAGNCGAALNGIGLLYQGGLDVIQSHSIAMSYFEKAAKTESAQAFNSLGDVYRHIYGTDVDLKAAFEYYTKSTNGFFKDGMLNLGIAYMEGSGTEVNRDLALYWFQRADLFGNEEAKNYTRKIIASSPQVQQTFHHNEDTQLSQLENKLQGIQLQSMEEKLAIVMAENELLKKELRG